MLSHWVGQTAHAPFTNFKNEELDDRSEGGNGSVSRLMSLPTEIHLQISRYLTYPDALALKHTNQHFFYIIDTGVELKIEWLIERRLLHLDCPREGCELGSDTKFCRGSIRLLMKRRREHFECDSQPGGRGCLIYGTDFCVNKKKRSALLRVSKWTTSMLQTSMAWWLSIGFVGLVCAWVWLGCNTVLVAVPTMF
ncbi:F-box domain-containing protein [Xylogone sp. PMI_703]|nr:F-box domain-containing protein [Xylogone sp. PMI_703]